MSGVCAREKAKGDNKENSPARTYNVRPLVLELGESSYPPPPTKNSRACHALRRARIAPGPRPMRRRASRVDHSTFCLKVLIRRDIFEMKSEKLRCYTYECSVCRNYSDNARRNTQHEKCLEIQLNRDIKTESKQ